ncbi:hypothetical protein DPMN_174007 [Dreissena polymorpha]|uniref:Uncharacterized protein n=1 Tax=Dreissena polymorpha TaxID=45954 RepID=A0A9D4E698_DREPO|nr:hypothetical protein DPMN_174007 [Dreissena polymorpha]
MIHVSLQIRSDLEKSPGHEAKWQSINGESVQNIISNSLYLFLVILFGGMSAVEEIMSSETSEESETKIQRILSVAQDIIYGEETDSKTCWIWTNAAPSNSLRNTCKFVPCSQSVYSDSNNKRI